MFRAIKEEDIVAEEAKTAKKELSDIQIDALTRIYKDVLAVKNKSEKVRKSDTKMKRRSHHSLETVIHFEPNSFSIPHPIKAPMNAKPCLTIPHIKNDFTCLLTLTGEPGSGNLPPTSLKIELSKPKGIEKLTVSLASYYSSIAIKSGRAYSLTSDWSTALGPKDMAIERVRLVVDVISSSFELAINILKQPRSQFHS